MKTNILSVGVCVTETQTSKFDAYAATDIDLPYVIYLKRTYNIVFSEKFDFSENDIANTKIRELLATDEVSVCEPSNQWVDTTTYYNRPDRDKTKEAISILSAAFPDYTFRPDMNLATIDTAIQRYALEILSGKKKRNIISRLFGK